MDTSVKKQVTAGTKRNLEKVIPEIIANITGYSATDRKYVFYKDSFCSHQSVREIIAAHQQGGQIVEKILATTCATSLFTGVNRIVATIPAADGWITAFFSARHMQFVLHGIHNEDLESLAA